MPLLFALWEGKDLAFFHPCHMHGPSHFAPPLRDLHLNLGYTNFNIYITVIIWMLFIVDPFVTSSLFLPFLIIYFHLLGFQPQTISKYSLQMFVMSSFALTSSSSSVPECYHLLQIHTGHHRCWFHPAGLQQDAGWDFPWLCPVSFSLSLLPHVGRHIGYQKAV